MSKRIIPVALCGVALACTGGERAWQGTVTDSAGITIVRNPTQGTWSADQRWTVEETLRIGTAEGDPEYQFGQVPASPGVAAIATASGGEIVVLDQQGQHVKVFTPEGRYARTIGGPGGGPGEIGLGASAVIIAPGDTILVSDIGNQRANLYLLDGTFVRSFPLSFADGIPFRWESAPDQRIVAQLRRLAFPGSTAPPDTMDVLVERNLDGSVGDTLMRVPSGKTVSFSGGAPEFKFFSPEPVWGLLGDRVLYAVSDQYRIGVYAPGGALERIVEKPFEREVVTGDDQDAVKDLLRRAWSDAGVPAQAVTQLMSRVQFAEHYPAFAQMIAGFDGSIWIQHIQAPSKLPPEAREGFNPQYDLASREWDVFDRDGRYLGIVAMPLRFQPVRFVGDRIYGVQRDELDVQYVVVLKLVNGGSTSGEE